jgi:hypothetical protein
MKWSILKDRRRSGERARSEMPCAGFLEPVWWGISLTEVVEDELEWMGVDETDECREPEPRTKLGIRRPGILEECVLIVEVAVSQRKCEVVTMILESCGVSG